MNKRIRELENQLEIQKQNLDKMSSLANEGNQDKLAFNDEFVSYINSLSESIKEYFKVTSNVNKNKKILIRNAPNLS